MLFRQLGQIDDEGTGLYYNRFRWYSADSGLYISQDPIGLAGNNPTLYGYVDNCNLQVDIFGLAWADLKPSGMGHHLFPRSIAKKLGLGDVIEHISWYPKKILDSGTLHQQLHQALRDAGLPTQGSKFTGSLDDVFAMMEKAYKKFNQAGTLKINGQKYSETPSSAIERIKKYLSGKGVKCK